MPGFVRSKKDEAKWKKAKIEASKSKNKDELSFSDRDWALVNHIFHQMKKKIDQKKYAELNNLQSDLIKVRRKLFDETDPYDMPEDEDLINEGFSTINDEGEPQDEYDEYGDTEDENEHQRGIDEDFGQTQDPLQGDPENDEYYPQRDNEPIRSSAKKIYQKEGSPSTKQSQSQATIQSEDTQEEIEGKRGRFKQPSREELASIRNYTIPWERRAREKVALEADPSKNPVLAREGDIIEARNKHHAERNKAYQELINSPEYKKSNRIQRMQMDKKFKEDWHAKDPDNMINAMKDHNDAHMAAQKYNYQFKAAKEAKIKDIVLGGAQAPETFSTEAGLQHAGGAKGEEGTVGTIKQDPIAAFAMGNQAFVKQFGKEWQQKNKKPLNIDEMMDYNKESKRDIGRILGEGPSKDPKFEQFFAHYYPLIGINANRTIKKLGLDPKNPEIDMSLLHEAGMHGLIQSINDYDHDHPSKASFATHASNKIRGLQTTAMKSLDQIPTEVREAQKKFRQQKTTEQEAVKQQPIEEPSTEEKLKNVQHPVARAQADRLKRTTVIRTAGTPKPPQPKIDIPKIEPENEDEDV